MSRAIMMVCCLLAGALAWPAQAREPAASTAPRVHVVVIDEMAFAPVPAGLRAGDVIEWQNRDLFQHTATARDGRFDVDLPAGAKARTVLTKGSVEFYCKYHPNMAGVLVVK